jgi:hypothetical protein
MNLTHDTFSRRVTAADWFSIIGTAVLHTMMPNGLPPTTAVWILLAAAPVPAGPALTDGRLALTSKYRNAFGISILQLGRTPW